MLLAKLFFFGSLFIILYVYLGYPVLISLLSRVRNKKVVKAPFYPGVSIIISAFNEEKFIENTIRNKLALNYPKERMQIIVISDGSTDKTEEIVKQYEQKGVKLLRQWPRSGKTAALNMAVQHATGEILVFSDANSIYELQALSKLMENFSDSVVGYVTGKMIYTNPDGTPIGDGCTAYMKYENYLRRMESRLGSIVGVDGGIDAVRKSLYQPMNPDQLPDFVLPLKVVKQGYRVVYEPEAILKEPSLKSSRDEYRMRVRVSLRALWALHDMRKLLSLRKYGLFAWQLWSHKVLRYLCWFFLLGAYIGNVFLFAENGFYRIFIVCQSLAYLGGFVSLSLSKIGYRYLSMFGYFLLLNGATMHAFLKFLLGHHKVIWTPRVG